MADIFTHERIYRGKEFDRIKKFTYVLFGLGALGSNIADNLARHGAVDFFGIDDDRVEEHNIGTQIYCLNDIGKQKGSVVSKYLYSVTKAKLNPIIERFNEDNLARIEKKFLGISDLILIDTFDNSESRQLVQDVSRVHKVNCIHAGMSGDGYGEVYWDEDYKVPGKSLGVDVCEYPLARNLAVMVSAICVESIVNFVISGEKSNYNFTIKDMNIRKA